MLNIVNSIKISSFYFFLHSIALSAHEYKVDDGEDHTFSLITNLGIPVNERNFQLLLEQFKGCSNFYIELIWAGENGEYNHSASVELRKRT